MTTHRVLALLTTAAAILATSGCSSAAAPADPALGLGVLFAVLGGFGFLAGGGGD